MRNEIIHGDCLEVMRNIPDKSVDVIFTSPPYADKRQKQYGGIAAKNYVAWFRPFALQIKRLLKTEGSFFLNIKAHTNDKSERDLYVFDLVLSLCRDVGFRFIDEFCWTKNGFPGKHIGRFKNAFEPVFHFSISGPDSIKFNPLACGTPIKKESLARAKRKQSGEPENGSGMRAMRNGNMQNLKMARPSNVVNINNVTNQYGLKKMHPATFPEDLVSFFISSFSYEFDTILDPFAGSGTTGVACINTDRDYILIEKEKKYCDIIEKRINQALCDSL